MPRFLTSSSLNSRADRARHRLRQVRRRRARCTALSTTRDRGHPRAEVGCAFGHDLLRAVGDRFDHVARRAELAAGKRLHGDASAGLRLHLGRDAFDHLHRRVTRGDHVAPAYRHFLRPRARANADAREQRKQHEASGRLAASGDRCGAAVAGLPGCLDVRIADPPSKVGVQGTGVSGRKTRDAPSPAGCGVARRAV